MQARHTTFPKQCKPPYCVPSLTTLVSYTKYNRASTLASQDTKVRQPIMESDLHELCRGLPQYGNRLLALAWGARCVSTYRSSLSKPSYASLPGSFICSLTHPPFELAEADADVYFLKLSLVARPLALLDSLRRCFSCSTLSK
jgi:hypothetical protein